MAENWQIAGFGLYLHWPFCQAKCPYCDFNSHVSARIDQERWARAYLHEVDRAARETPGRIVRSVFFGGGTPSLMDPDLVARIIARIRAQWQTSNSLEITLEANPTSVEAGKFRAFRAAGVNRISMGIQALNDTDLKALGRLHSTAEARAAFDIARANFDRVSFDLIYARQGQNRAAWQSELREALAMAVDHLSLYQLTIEAGTAFGDRFARGKLGGLPSEDLAADMFFDTQEITQAAGFSAYEVSNHAKPGCESLHNLIYWRGGDYIGIGPGAHGRLDLNGTRYATETPLAPEAWLRQVEGEGQGEAPRTALTQDEILSETLLMGLRLTEGVPWDRLAPRQKNQVLQNNINDLQQDGMIMSDAARLAVTPTGRPLLNAVLAKLLA